MKYKFIIPLFLLGLSCKSPNGPVPSKWAPSGLDGTSITALVTMGSHVFAGTPNGVYRLDDNGVSWVSFSSGLTDLNITSLAVIGSDLYAGTQTDNQESPVFLSTDSGITWKNLFNVNNLSQSTSALGVSGKTLFAATRGGVFRWKDGGSTWIPSDTGLEGTLINTFASSGNYILAGSFSGLFLSSDGGSHWIASNDGLTTPIVLSLATIGTNIFAGIGDQNGTGAGVFISTDNGATWLLRNNGLPISSTLDNEVWSIAAGDTTIFAGSQDGVYSSTTNGALWTPENSTLHDLILSMTATAKNIYAGTSSSGVWVRALP